jgi:hypothetical protein
MAETHQWHCTGRNSPSRVLGKADHKDSQWSYIGYRPTLGETVEKDEDCWVLLSIHALQEVGTGITVLLQKLDTHLLPSLQD